MIHFACPGCQKAFRVADEKAGRAGKCPTCGTGFVVPDAPAAEPPASLVVAAAPPRGASDPVEIAPCPKCGMALTVSPESLGAEVECPGCRTIFTAADKSAVVRADSPSARRAPRREDPLDDDADDRPSRRRRREEGEQEDRPSRRRVRRDDDGEDDRPIRSSKRLREEEDDEDDRPRKPKRTKSRRGSTEESKRIPAALLAFFLGNFGVHKFFLGYTTAGIVMLLTCGGMGILSLIDFIIYITMSDEQFVETYQIGQKEWF